MMLRTVLKYKENIEQMIKLDRYKRYALKVTWEKVNRQVSSRSRRRLHLIFVPRDFGDIFAELLPGSFEKLQSPDNQLNQDLMDGLEIRVQLGSV